MRVYVGEASQEGYEKEEVILIETNIDDMNPELLAYAAETLLKQGALDVFMTPIYMKKHRPGITLSVLTTEDKLDHMLSIVFGETTTLGVRIHRLEKKKLSRETISVATRFGKVKVKVGKMGNQIKNISPEYESCQEIAQRQEIPLQDVYDEAKEAARKALYKGKKTSS